MKSRASAAAEGRKRQLLAQRRKASPRAESPLKGPFEGSVAALLYLPQVVSGQSEMAAKVQAVRAFLDGWQAEVHGRWEEVAAVLAVRNGWNFTVGREHTLLMRIAIGVPDKSRWIGKRGAIKTKTESLAKLASELALAYQNTLEIETALVAQAIRSGGGLKPFNASQRSSANKKRPVKKG